jgi:hypothetical protein
VNDSPAGASGFRLVSTVRNEGDAGLAVGDEPGSVKRGRERSGRTSARVPCRLRVPGREVLDGEGLRAAPAVLVDEVPERAFVVVGA